MITANPKKMNRYCRGVALVATLVILTILAIMAVFFSIQMRTEIKMSRTYIQKSQLDIIILSAVEHAKAQLFVDKIEQPDYDSLIEPWSSSFRKEPRWIYVRRKNGSIIGRYSINIQDETGKINANSASAFGDYMQNQGVDTFEIILSDGKNRGLPISLNSAKKILQYRYGRDKSPGQAHVDDNVNNMSLTRDGIDNNGNGIIDEPDEGVDEPAEYNAAGPQWDDRAFNSIDAIANLCKIDGPSPRSFLKKYCTVYSHSRDMYWSDQAGKLQLPVNINVSTTRQIHKALRRGNKRNPFESSSKNLRILSANIIDYRDENHVLTTLGSEYGIEAVCFNEIMANDGSFDLEADHQDLSGSKYTYVHRFGYWYDNREYPPDYRLGWKVKHFSKTGGKRNVLMEGKKLNLPFATVSLSDGPIRYNKKGGHYSRFKKILNSMGGWVPDMWRNAELVVWKDKKAKEVIRFPIAGNTKNNLLVCYDNSKNFSFNELTLTTNKDVTVRIDTMWYPGPANWCVFPEQTEYWVFPTQIDSEVKRPDSLYYYVYIGEQNFARKIRTMFLHHPFNVNPPANRPWKGYNFYLDTDGIPASYSETAMETLLAEDLKDTTLELPQGESSINLLRTPYKKAQPVRAKKGWMHVCLTSGRKTGYVGGLKSVPHKTAFENKNAFDAVYIMRPDIVELINICSKPISLNNWQIVINTGNSADRVGLIGNVPRYSLNRRGKYIDPNPSIQPNEYFYLTNNRDIFDREYGGTKNGDWGDAETEAYGCYELPDSLWGVRYKIEQAKDNYIRVSGASWKKDQMKNEMIEFQTISHSADRNGISGVRRSVLRNTRDTLFLQNGVWVDDQPYNMGIKSGDTALILGLPRAGGFLSMTLKNEYGQIAARILEYGSLDINQIEYSTQKTDPTRYNWELSKHPTFGGKKEIAENHGSTHNSADQTIIKNSPLSSIAEINSIKSAEEWKNIGGSQKNNRGGLQVLKAIGKYFTTSGIRLDPEEKNVHISGWKPSFGNANFASSGTINAKNTSWTPDIWAHQKLQILSGKQRGETFLISRNTENTAQIDGFSLPSGKQLHVEAGDSFSVGPGYATPMFYTRNEAEEGVWEWKNKGLEKCHYALYIGGLNDSIDTTEFLEENYNAQIDVLAYNFKNRKFDKLPLNIDESSFSELCGHPASKTGRFQYEKSDCFFCGFITPNHISPEKGLRLKLIPHGLNNQKNSGFAWFDYAYLTPGTWIGKININTAPPRVLSSLKNIDQKLAENIYSGIDSHNKKKLKPYKDITHLLDVKGISPKIFGSICNLISTRGNQFRIKIVAETINDINGNGIFDKKNGESITSSGTKDIIIDREKYNY